MRGIFFFFFKFHKNKSKAPPPPKKLMIMQFQILFILSIDVLVDLTPLITSNKFILSNFNSMFFPSLMKWLMVHLKENLMFYFCICTVRHEINMMLQNFRENSLKFWDIIKFGI